MIKILIHLTVLQEVNCSFHLKNKPKDHFIKNFKNYNNKLFLNLYQLTKMMLEDKNYKKNKKVRELMPFHHIVNMTY